MKVYKPLGTKVIVDVFAKEEGTSKSGIVIGDLPQLSGQVIEVGKDVLEVKKGDIVVFEQGAPIPINPMLNTLSWMEEGQIVYIVTEVPDEVKGD